MANFGAYLEHKYEPPFEDWWNIKAIDTTLKRLSEELLGLPDEVLATRPRLRQLSRILDRAIIKRASYWEMGPSQPDGVWREREG